MKVALGIAGTILILIGLAQGWMLAGALGNYGDTVAGPAGGSIPVLFGVIGTFFLVKAYEPKRDKN